MKVSISVLAVLAFAGMAHADFSYKVTRKTGGMMAAMAGGGNGPQVSTYYFKGQRMKFDSGATAFVVDFDGQTITTINNTAKTYTVKNFSDMAGAANDAEMNAKIDVRETGEKKMVNGFNAGETVMTMEVDSPQTAQLGKMRMEIDIWASPEVPGSDQLHDFYRRNGSRMPWGAIAGGANPSMQKAMADMQRKLSAIGGVPVEEVVRIKSAGGAGAPAMPQMSAAQSGQMAQARAKLEAMAAQGGPQAAFAKQALDRMGGASAPPAAGGAMIEITMDSSDFSTEPVSDGVFAIPAGYQKN